jgi:hypothetical protein
MVFAMNFAGLTAALLSAASIPATIPAGTQPSQAELEAAIRAHYVRLAAHPMACRARVGCLKPPKAIKVSNYDCQVTDTDPKGGSILYCRVTYTHKGGSLAYVKSPNECVPLRASEAISTDTGGLVLAWEVALVDSKGRCPGARE